MDFEKFMKEGLSNFELPPPKDIWEATNHLMILYHHILRLLLSVYVGNLDKLLEPFVKKEKEEAYHAIKFLLLHIDRTITDSFCHANIGPEKTLAGELILKATQELNTMTPNITLKYDRDITPDDFALLAIRNFHQR